MLTSTEDNNFEKSLVKWLWEYNRTLWIEWIYQQVQLIEDAGHKVEVHKVPTEDNYILTVFRLPSKLKKPKIAFIMHGIITEEIIIPYTGNEIDLL